jgi:hypothetical protein
VNRLITRVKGAKDYQTKKRPGEVAIAEGGILNRSTFRKKISYTTELLKNGKPSGEFISIGTEVLSFSLFAHEPNVAEKGRIESMMFPDGRKKVKFTGLANSHNGRHGLSHTGVMRLKFSVMLRDGTYAKEYAYLPGVVGIPNDYLLQLELLDGKVEL